MSSLDRHILMAVIHIRYTFSFVLMVCVQNDRDSADYILRTITQSEAAKVAEER